MSLDYSVSRDLCSQVILGYTRHYGSDNMGGKTLKKV